MHARMNVIEIVAEKFVFRLTSSCCDHAVVVWFVACLRIGRNASVVDELLCFRASEYYDQQIPNFPNNKYLGRTFVTKGDGCESCASGECVVFFGVCGVTKGGCVVCENNSQGLWK